MQWFQLVLLLTLQLVLTPLKSIRQVMMAHSHLGIEALQNLKNREPDLDASVAFEMRLRGVLQKQDVEAVQAQEEGFQVALEENHSEVECAFFEAADYEERAKEGIAHCKAEFVHQLAYFDSEAYQEMDIVEENVVHVVVVGEDMLVEVEKSWVGERSHFVERGLAVAVAENNQMGDHQRHCNEVVVEEIVLCLAVR